MWVDVDALEWSTKDQIWVQDENTYKHKTTNDIFNVVCFNVLKMGWGKRSHDRK